MLTTLTLLTCILITAVKTSSLPHQLSSRYFQWGKEPVRGVNLGGWLVLEVRYIWRSLTFQPWITPSLFEDKPEWVVDEWSYGAYSRNQKDVYGEIRDHWRSWYQKSDLATMKRVGLVSESFARLMEEYSTDTHRL